MTLAIWIVFAVLVVAFALFVTGWLGPDLIAMMVLVTLVLTGVIAPGDAFQGFSSDAVVTIAGLMVIGYGLERTGVVAVVARRMSAVIRMKYNRLLLLNTGIPGILSGFVNIVAAASFFIPVILRLCKQMKVPQSKILLPMAAAALIGANLSLIGASHNLVVDSLLYQATGIGFGFFEFTAVGGVLMVAALIYIFVLGQHLLPGEKRTPASDEVPVSQHLFDTYELEDRLFELWVSEGEREKIDYTLAQLELNGRGPVAVALVREGDLIVLPDLDTPLETGDLLLLQGRQHQVDTLANEHEILTFIGPPDSEEKYPISTAELAEAVVLPRSKAIGGTIAELNLVERFGTTALAYFRDGRPHRVDVQENVLQEGDVILLYGPRERMRDLEPERDLLIYYMPGHGTPEVSPEMRRMAPVAAAILALAIVMSAIGWMPIAATATTGAVVMVLIGIVPIKQVYDSIDWKTLVLIGGMYPLGVALNQTGAANLIGELLITTLGGYGPLAVLAGIVILTMILTQPIHNAAVAIIMTPVAINAASMMNVDPKGFAVGVLVACSAAFMMPYGHPAPMLVQEPGGYKPSDYLRFGIGLNIITLAVILGMVPLLWSI